VVAGVSARVLIVDDDPDSVAMLEAFLSEEAESIQTVTDSKLVEQAFQDFEPDIVLLDLHMPNPDGLEILRRLRTARQKLGFVPVVVLTGDTGKVARNSALVLGADDFLLKPLDKQEVVLRVRNLLRTRRLYLDLARSNEELERDLRGRK
jgi:putative two-component system response regulator